MEKESLFSCDLLEHYGCKVYDRPRALGGLQVIQSPDGHVFKLKFNSGLMYLPMRYPTEQEIENLPHVYLTSNAEQWNPDAFGDDVTDDQWFDAVDEYEDGALDDDDFFDSRDTFVIEPNFQRAML